MDQNQGKFVSLPFDPKESDRVIARCVQARLDLNPQGASPEVKPCLSIGEIVPVKGVMFRVVKMKEDGRLTLKMLNRAEVQALSGRE